MREEHQRKAHTGVPQVFDKMKYFVALMRQATIVIVIAVLVTEIYGEEISLSREVLRDRAKGISVMPQVSPRDPTKIVTQKFESVLPRLGGIATEAMQKKNRVVRQRDRKLIWRCVNGPCRTAQDSVPLREYAEAVLASIFEGGTAIRETSAWTR